MNSRDQSESKCPAFRLNSPGKGWQVAEGILVPKFLCLLALIVTDLT